MATIINLSGIEDAKDTYKTYYVRIIFEGRNYYKIGKCNGSIARRFGREPITTIIEIIHIWLHSSSEKAERHEDKLFRQYKHGDLPFMFNCGPLTRYNRSQGNTEVFSHDVIGGEPAPFFFKARIFYRDENTCYARVYPDGDPRQPWSEHINDYWLQRSLYPQDQYEGSIYQIPLLSTKTAVTLATSWCLEDLVENKLFSAPLTKRVVLDALEREIIIKEWSDYWIMDFDSSRGFTIPGDIWI
ncbi:TPA: hypothetical protein ACU8BO_000260 [Neisseria subflava]|jgi:hypothetical protein